MREAQRYRRGFTVVFAVVASGCVTARGPANTPLSAAINRALQPLEDAGATISYAVRTLDGEVMAERNARALVTPASTVKVLTTSAVMNAFPPDHRFQTRISGPAHDSGKIEGDLWIVGGGDPSFGSARFADAERGTIDSRPSESDVATKIAESLKAQGVTKITGDIVGDARLFPQPRLLAGWSWDDAAYSYSVRPSALTYLEGLTRMTLKERGGDVLPGFEPDTRLVDVYVVREPEKERSFWMWMDGPGRMTVHWQGNDEDGLRRRWIAVSNPAGYAAEQVKAALTLAGIEVSGEARTATTGDPAPNMARTYATIDGPTVLQLCAVTNQQSLNLYAELLLMHVGRAKNQDATTTGGLDVVFADLASMGVSKNDVRLVDGSGLSRYNLVSSEVMTRHLAETLRRNPAFINTLAQSGRVGTIRKRWTGTAAEGRVWGKTGTLTGHRNIVGVVRGKTDRVFAFLVSGVVVGRRTVDGAVDAAVLEILDSTR